MNHYKTGGYGKQSTVTRYASPSSKQVHVYRLISHTQHQTQWNVGVTVSDQLISSTPHWFSIHALVMVLVKDTWLNSNSHHIKVQRSVNITGVWAAFNLDGIKQAVKTGSSADLETEPRLSSPGDSDRTVNHEKPEQPECVTTLQVNQTENARFFNNSGSGFISPYLWLRSRRSICYHPLSAFWTEWPDAARSVSEPFPSPIASSSRPVCCQRLWIKITDLFPRLTLFSCIVINGRPTPVKWNYDGHTATERRLGRDRSAEYGRLEELTGSGNREKKGTVSVLKEDFKYFNWRTGRFFNSELSGIICLIILKVKPMLCETQMLTLLWLLRHFWRMCALVGWTAGLT